MVKSHEIRVGTIQYPFTPIKRWQDFTASIKSFVHQAVKEDVHILVFPEYLILHLACLHPNAQPFFEAFQQYLSRFLELFAKLAMDHHMVIQSGSFPVKAAPGRYFNRAFLFDTNGSWVFQDKIHLTPCEVETNQFEPGIKKEISLFETLFGRIAIAICYDVEFPFLVKQAVAKGADIILVPSATGTLAGHYRVTLSCRARALENQCYVIKSTLTGPARWVDEDCKHTGKAGIFCPCEVHFPSSGVIAEGRINHSDLVVGTVNLDMLHRVRQEGEVRNFRDYTMK